MIVTGLLLFLQGIFVLLYTILPSGTYLSGVSTGVQWVYAQAMGFNWLFPVSYILGILGIIVTVELFFFTWHSIRFIIRIVRGA